MLCVGIRRCEGEGKIRNAGRAVEGRGETCILKGARHDDHPPQTDELFFVLIAASANGALDGMCQYSLRAELHAVAPAGPMSYA